MRTIISKLGLIVCLCFSFLFCMSFLLMTTAVSQQQASKDEIDKASQEIQQIVKDVFRGDKLQEVKSSISLGAYIIEGSSYQSLFESLYGKERSRAFAQEKNRQMSFLQLSINDDVNAAHLVAKTESAKHSDPRYHSVFFMKSKTGKWQIQNWHTSN
jgi:hypothetical protein